MQLTFSGEIWFWRGPSPFYFITVPDDLGPDLEDLSGLVSYGWGMIPVTVTIGSTTWQTSLFPKDGGYVVPIKAHVRKSEGLDEGHMSTVQLSVET